MVGENLSVLHYRDRQDVHVIFDDDVQAGIAPPALYLGGGVHRDVEEEFRARARAPRPLEILDVVAAIQDEAASIMQSEFDANGR